MSKIYVFKHYPPTPPPPFLGPGTFAPNSHTYSPLFEKILDLRLQLKALSKIIEKSVALQLNNCLMNNNLHENFQSAYKVHHSTETVMVKVQDDILHAIDGNKAVVLLMLDLSAAFDSASWNTTG